ncbi:hypothetical protein [Micromonospora coxensis]|uniref:Uncharacterized protein n=1 Tax=Micromonospora coxensis TaxID=356852 RepID=A0A1C5JPV2_9ACTN|nr:hypothetical protein [Micromonospora coxensis]SCG72513.1 hypothetical protein GA0070614_5013 [Micromonospora coxensis]
MNAHRMDQETVERLLVGPAVDPQDGPASLVRLLAAVRAAPHPAELRGEAAAMQAFQRARAGAPLPVRAPSTRTGVLAGLAGLKVALAALAVAATGGVALAAVTGTLPGQPERDDPGTRPSAAPVPTASATAGADPSGSPAATDAPPSSPTASILGLCRAYRADAGDNPGRTLENPVFTDLITTAGGRNKVAAYCERAIRDAQSPGAATDRGDATPTAGSSRRPTQHATGAPTAPPTSAPPVPTEPPVPAGKPTLPAPDRTDPPRPD